MVYWHLPGPVKGLWHPWPQHLTAEAFSLWCRGVAFDWFRSYLTNRIQYTEFRSATSRKLRIECGVPQGSFLGPLPFLVYINDIVNTPSNAKLLLFADDTNLLLEHEKFYDVVNLANTELKNVSKWFVSNKLSLNVDKTKFIIFRTANKTIPTIPVITINSLEIKFLGVFIDELLNWKFHINNKNKNISNSLAIIHLIKNFIPLSTRKTLYYGLIHPHLSYGVLAWGNTHSKEISHLKTLQKRAVRFIGRTEIQLPQ